MNWHRQLLRTWLGIGLIGMLILPGCKSADKDYSEAEPVQRSPDEVHNPGRIISDDEEREAELMVKEVLQRTPDPVQNEIAEKSGMAVPAEKQPVNLDREQAAQLIAYYRLDDVQVAVVSQEQLNEQGLGDEVAQRIREVFSELGMRVQNASGANIVGSDRQTIRQVAATYDADLLVIMLGEARERSKFGNFYSYESELRGTVYEAGGDLVATKEITTVGKRSTRTADAAESALLAGADNIGPFLVEQILRKVGQNVVTRRITIEGIRYNASAMKIVDHLKKQAGINDVRLLWWNERTETARMLIYLQPAARNNLPGYISKVPDLDIRIVDANQRELTGEERKTDR